MEKVIFSGRKKQLKRQAVTYGKYRHSETSKDIYSIDTVSVENYFCIKDLELTGLKDKKEIYILGENGDGKTLLLQAIILALKGKKQGVVSDFLGENARSIKASVTFEHTIRQVFADERTYGHYDGLGDYPVVEEMAYPPLNSAIILAYGVSRNRNDSDKCDKSGYLTLFSSEQYLNNPVKWLQYLDYKEAKGETGSISLAKAIEMLQQILNENVEIKVSPSKVIFIERGTEVQFDQLAEGYKSVLIWITDMIQRLSESQPEVTELAQYRGTVLVDEIGLHLHPKWEYRIVRDVRRWFPEIQFIFTTHSPTVILGSSEEAVFYKLYKKDGITHVTQPVKSLKNQMMNSVITSPLFNNDVARAYNSDSENLETGDDFLYNKIHRQIRERVANRNDITEEELQRMISEALDESEVQG